MNINDFLLTIVGKKEIDIFPVGHEEVFSEHGRTICLVENVKVLTPVTLSRRTLPNPYVFCGFIGKDVCKPFTVLGSHWADMD